MAPRQQKLPRRTAKITVMTALLLVPMLSFIALGIDLGYIAMASAQLQAAADSAALAASSEMLTNYDASAQQASRAAAADITAANLVANQSPVLNTNTDVTYGLWNSTTRTLDSPDLNHATVKVNAVRVRVWRSQATGSSLTLFFAKVMGRNSADLVAEATAYIPQPVASVELPGFGTRFLIDDEMFDTDEPAIQSLASSLGTTPDHLLSAKNETSANMVDWFLNLPPGAILNLPTGQAGDEGLLDLDANKGTPTLPQYPFQDQVSHTKFLKYNETSASDPVSQMRSSILPKSSLDPLPGVGRFNQPSKYPDLVNPDFIHVSPVWKSDASALDGVAQTNQNAGPDLDGDGDADGHTTNDSVQKGVNSLGYRRGLVAFKIIGYNINPSKPYPYLPYLTIKIVDPNTIDLNVVPPGGGKTVYKAGSVHNLRLVK
jgi:Flp pilus assembly protein TadG